MLLTFGLLSRLALSALISSALAEALSWCAVGGPGGESVA